MGIATDCCDAFHSKIERLTRETGLLQERHDETPEAAIHMEANVISLREPSETDDIVLTAIWEVDSGTGDLEILG